MWFLRVKVKFVSDGPSFGERGGGGGWCGLRAGLGFGVVGSGLVSLSSLGHRRTSGFCRWGQAAVACVGAPEERGPPGLDAEPRRDLRHPFSRSVHR